MRGLGAALSILGVLAFPSAVPASGPASDFRPGELLVRFTPSSSPAARVAALDALDARIVERLPLRGLVRVRLEPGTPLAAADAALERRPAVLYAEPNRRYRFMVTPNDPSFGSLWGLHQTSDADIDATEAWDTLTGSDSMTVAVVDSGIARTHPDLSTNLWVNPGETAANGVDDDGNGKIDDVNGWDFVDNDADPDDLVEHGTHVSGTIGAQGGNNVGVTGVNWDVRLMGLKAGDEDGLTESWIVNAFQYACAKGAKVVNGSFGGGGWSQAISDAIASCPNTLFVFAAGNDATDNDVEPTYPCNDPGPNVLCVAATNSSDQLAYFSNVGRASVDIAAPGENILSTIPSGYDWFDGTSMASPHAAGAAALVWAHRPGLTATEIRRALILSADDKPGLAGMVASGGRLNVHRALTQDVIPPAGLAASSPSHTQGVWTNRTAVTVSWSGAFDLDGIDGYSLAFAASANSVPDEIKDVEENVTSLTNGLPDGIHWFQVRAVDGAGNWSDPVRLGPFQIDTFPGIRPVVSSPTHHPGVPSATRTVAAIWTGASDATSGLDGYSFAWSQTEASKADQTKDAEENTLRATSPVLAPGSWWFSIRVVDNAGNWTDAVSLGPFVIRSPPACAVPKLRGLTLAAAKRRLAKGGCALGRVSRAHSSRVRRGRVIAQRPRPGLRLRRGAKVRVVLSRGRRR